MWAPLILLYNDVLLSPPADRMEMGLDMPGPVLTHLEQVNSVSGQLYYERGQNGVLGNGSATGR